MAKYKKREVHMIDMTNRLKVRIIEGTLDEDNRYEQEFEKMQYAIEERTRRYEKEIRDLVISANTETCIKVTTNDTEYFIKKYNKEFIDKNPDNIKNRILMLQQYIEEQD